MVIKANKVYQRKNKHVSSIFILKKNNNLFEEYNNNISINY